MSADTGWLKTIALMVVTLAVLAAMLFASTAKIGAASISGWPVGYLLVAQGGLIAMALLFLLFNRKQSAIEISKLPRPSPLTRSRGNHKANHVHA